MANNGAAAERPCFDTLVPTVSLRALKKRRVVKRPAKPWRLAPFTNPARSDGLVLRHWVPAATAADADYPFAKFNRPTELLFYDDATYAEHFEQPVESQSESSEESSSSSSTSTSPSSSSLSLSLSSSDQCSSQLVVSTSSSSTGLASSSSQSLSHCAPWTRAETDFLLSLCQQLDLRWPVILDRFLARSDFSARPLEDLKARFFQVQTKLAALAGDSSSLIPADYVYEREHAIRRRMQLESFFARTKIETEAEKGLLAEAQATELVLQKIQRDYERVRLSAETSLASPVFDMDAYSKKLKDVYLNSESSYLSGNNKGFQQYDVLIHWLPELRGGRPGRAYLRSTDLHRPVQFGTKIGKRVDMALTELHVDLKPMPTQLCALAFEGLRKDLIILLELHAILNKKIAERNLLRERVRQFHVLDAMKNS